MLFDTHAHLDDARYDEDRQATILRAYESGVTHILNASADIVSSRDSMSLAHEFDFVYAAVGVHPHNVSGLDEKVLDTLGSFASGSKVVAIGEIGLDYYYDLSPRDEQKYWLARQINLAASLGLPVIIHDRDAHEDVLNIVKKEKASRVGGVFHCFTGSAEMARDLLKEGFYISFGGAVTFKNARRLPEVVKCIPDDRLLIETDCPYLTPEPYRGKRNEPAYVRLVAEKIAQIRDTTVEEIVRITTGNAKRLFKIN